MTETLVRFITIQPLNYHPIIGWALALIWTLLVGNCLASLRTRHFSIPARFCWAAVIVLVPVAGMLAFLVFCLFTADYSFLKFVLGPPRHVKAKGAAALRLPQK